MIIMYIILALIIIRVVKTIKAKKADADRVHRKISGMIAFTPEGRKLLVKIAHK